MIRINLLPVRAEKKRETLRQQIAGAIGVFVLVGAILFTVHGAKASELEAANNELKSIKDEIKRLEKTIDDVKAFEQENEKLKKTLDVIENLEKGRTTTLVMLDDLAALVPENLFITAFDQKGPALLIKGQALDNTVVARFLDNLQRSDSFTGPLLKGTKESTVGNYRMVDFDISMTVKAVQAADEAIAAASGGAVDKKKGR